VRNLTKVSYVTRDQLSAIDVIKADFIVLAQPTISKIEEVLQ
jgi:ribosomal protein L4